MMLEAGTPAPDVQLPLLEGEAFSLEQQWKEGPVLLVFYKVSCPTCQLTLPFLERLHQAEGGGAPRIYGISQDDANATREFHQHFALTFPTMLDLKSEGYQASNAYRITNVPSLFLIADGRIVWTLNGFHKGDLEALGARFGRSPFTANDRVPAMKPG